MQPPPLALPWPCPILIDFSLPCPHPCPHHQFCTDAVEQCVRELGGLDILVNNAAEQVRVGAFSPYDAHHLLHMGCHHALIQAFIPHIQPTTHPLIFLTDAVSFKFPQHARERLEDITPEQLQRTFATNM